MLTGQLLCLFSHSVSQSLLLPIPGRLGRLDRGRGRGDAVVIWREEVCRARARERWGREGWQG